MKHYPKALRSMAIVVLAAFSFMAVFVAPVQATMIGTDTVLGTSNADMARQKVKVFLDRQDVAKQLEAWGVTPQEAQGRVDAMTANEVDLLAQQIDQLPAGGNTLLGFVLLAALISFIVLVILDIVGVTDIFTFIKKR